MTRELSYVSSFLLRPLRAVAATYGWSLLPKVDMFLVPARRGLSRGFEQGSARIIGSDPLPAAAYSKKLVFQLVTVHGAAAGYGLLKYFVLTHYPHRLPTRPGPPGAVRYGTSGWDRGGPLLGALVHRLLLGLLCGHHCGYRSTVRYASHSSFRFEQQWRLGCARSTARSSALGAAGWQWVGISGKAAFAELGIAVFLCSSEFAYC
eukprot:765839-Hanusia_phi.AAC.2